MQWLAGVFKDVGNDIADGTLAVAPVVEGVDTAANQYEALVFNEFVVNCLGGNVFTLEGAVFD